MKEILWPKPKLNQTISAHFHGTLTNGEVFWTSIDGDPLTIELSKLIIGCQKTIPLMKKGDKWRVFIDPTMAYGEVGNHQQKRAQEYLQIQFYL